MVKKLKRNYCIVKFRNLPLQHFDKKTNSDIFYNPKREGFYWIKLPETKKDNSKELIDEITKLIARLNIENLIFLDEIDKPWILKYIAKRNDFKKLTKALDYFKSNKIWTTFNGGVLVSKIDWKFFLKHFYTITECDSAFFFYNFIDEEQKIIFYIHYSGEISVTTLNKKIDDKFLQQIKKTKFIDSNRENTKRI